MRCADESGAHRVAADVAVAELHRDRPRIARVIYTRLAHNSPLQIYATHLYNVPPEEIEEEGAITRLRDVDTPWNTFTNTGLPATPIANPGRASIEAALEPVKFFERICQGGSDVGSRFAVQPLGLD